MQTRLNKRKPFFFGANFPVCHFAIKEFRERKENKQIERVGPINKTLPFTLSQLKETVFELHLFIWYHVYPKWLISGESKKQEFFKA